MKTSAVLVERSRLVGVAALTGVVSIATSTLLMMVAPGVAPDLSLGVIAFGWPFVLVLVVAWTAYWRATRTAVKLRVENGALLVAARRGAPPAR